MRESTKAIYGHEFVDEDLGVFIPPIYLTAVFEQRGSTLTTDRGTDLKYSREENPTVRALEKVLSKLEEGVDSLAFNSGMASISAVLLNFINKDLKVVALMELYGSTLQLLQLLSNKVGFKLHLSWPETSELIEDLKSFKPNLVFIESITNPMLRVIDVTEVAKICRDLGCKLIVDNTFATPLLLNPLSNGAVLVVHSLTKYIAGHNDVLGGALIAKDSALIQSLWDWRRLIGGIMQPLEAYLTLRGVKTLEVRFEKSSKTAMSIAEYLSDNTKVAEVHYPGLSNSPYKSIADRIFKKRLYGGVVTFKLKGGMSEAVKFLKSLKIIKPSPSLGGTESLITYPIISASKNIPRDVREKLGITESTLRLSVGLEDQEDIIEDIDQALASLS
ncbi:MAG: cystathionine gamma-synthase family protein [Desulfurococcaceae archaeon]